MATNQDPLKMVGKAVAPIVNAHADLLKNAPEEIKPITQIMHTPVEASKPLLEPIADPELTAAQNALDTAAKPKAAGRTKGKGLGALLPKLGTRGKTAGPVLPGPTTEKKDLKKFTEELLA